MNTAPGFNHIDLLVILSQLRSNKPIIQEYSAKQVGSFLNKNREYADDIISKIAEFFDKNINDISETLLIKVITNILNVLQENNISMTNFMSKIFPILMHIIYYCNRTIEQYDIVTKVIGNLINKCGIYTSQIIESHVNSIFDKFKKEQSFKYEYTKYAMISVLKEFLKNSPVISYNKIIEAYESFNDIILNYKDTKEYIRYATQSLIREFLLLLSNRDLEIREDFTKRIYKTCIYNVVKNNISDPNVTHGVILVLQACTVRREFFNEKYKITMDFLNRNKTHKSQNVRIAIIDVIPYFAEYLKDVFEENYLNMFMEHFISLYNSKPTIEIKAHLLQCFGKLSLIITKSKFIPHSKSILRLVKGDIEKNVSTFNISILDCLADFLKRFSDETLTELPFSQILEKMFNCGFYENHIVFLNQLISLFEHGSKEVIKIMLVVLNVISIIISDRKFILKDTLSKLKIMSYDIDSSERSFKLDLINQSSQVIISPTSYSIDEANLNLRKNNSMNNFHNIINENKISLNEARKSIIAYIFNMKSSSKGNFNLIMAELIKNALTFLKDINHPFFAKDILFFYQQFCVKMLETSDTKIKQKIIDLANAQWIPNIYNNGIDTSNDCLSLRKQSTSSITSGKVVIDPEVEFVLHIIVDSFLNVILSEQNEDIKLDMLNNIDDPRYHMLLSENAFFHKLTFVLKTANNAIKEKAICIIGKIITLNYTAITIFIKKSLLEIFATLEISTNIFEKEDAIVLMSYYVKYTGMYIVDYVQIIFSTLIKILKSETTFDTDSEVQKAYSNNMLIVSILTIIRELINNNYYNDKKTIEKYYKDIIVICISILKENASIQKQEISLMTVLSILENSDKDWKIYYDYIDLVSLLIQILIRETNKKSRLYAMKIFGFIGAMDPEKLERLMNYHKSENDKYANEYYMADEYNNYDDDDDILDRQMMIKNKNNLKENFDVANHNKKKFNFDFQKEINENELDTCTYHAVNTLMKILKTNANQETCNKVIIVLKDILANLNDTDNTVIYLILPTMIDALNDFEGNTQTMIFERISFIIKTFKYICRPFISDLVDVVIKYFFEREFQKIICEILMKMLELFLDDMENYFPKLVPIMLEVLNDKTTYDKATTITMRKNIFKCFIFMSSKISNYLGLVVPEMVNILYSSMNEIKYDYVYASNIVNNINTKNAISSIATGSSFTPSNNTSMTGINDEKGKDEEIFVFIENIIKLPAFSQQMPKVISILLKYMEVIPSSREKIMKIFLLMMNNFKNIFLTFFPLVVRTSKAIGIPQLQFFNAFKKALERDEIIELINNYDPKTHSVLNNLRKKTLDSSDESSLPKIRSRSGMMNRESLLNEFNPSNCSIEDDWREWFKSSSKSLFLQSPSHALFCCQSVSDYYPPLISELYNYAFISVWKMLNMDQKALLISYLNTALEGSKTPPEILLTILNLAEFIEREENHIEFINFEKLGQVADVCKAYAKALYYVENDFRNNNDFSSLEKLITLYYDLELPESAIGILKMAKINNKFINEEDWYLKLHQWKESLDVIKKRPMISNGKIDLDLTKRFFICLDGLSDWESLLSLGDEVEKVDTLNDDILTRMSPELAKASFNLGEWDKLKHYSNKIKPEEDIQVYEKNFFDAIIAIKSFDFNAARNFIDEARSAIDDKIKTLLSESYQRAYKLLLANEHLYELEEIISLQTSNDSVDEVEKKKKELKKKWDGRLELTDRDIKSYERILAIRRLVFKIDEDYDTHLKLAKICRKEDRFTTCMIVLNRLSKRLQHCCNNVSVNVMLSISKCLNENNNQKDSEAAIDNLKKIIDNEINTIDDTLKSKIYCYYAIWNAQMIEKRLTEDKVSSILNYLELSTKYNSKNYKAWHNYALLNYKFFEMENTMTYNAYASNAIKGFTKSVCIGGKSISKTLQDLLRLIDLWFQVGSDSTLNELIMTSFDQIAIESWLMVIPQLLARVGVTNETIRNSLVYILKKIGLNHPRSLSYPLIVMHQSKSKIRAKAADLILTEMNTKHGKLIKECELIINELNRCALLLHEQWSEAIEESAKLFFQSKDLNGMVKTLKEAHLKMDCEPVTMNEVHFHQMYKSELDEAKRYLNDYLQTKNEMDIKQAWDIYHPIFKNMNDNFSTLKYLDLENVSPNLFHFKESEICIPGMYRSGYPVVKIASFSKTLTVLNSKQHPRKIIIYGSNGKEYMFLLKGHEDLRQDERAMQLFGLVNTLLSNDQDTSDKNLFIKRFPVIPLSHNTGIIGWVPNCDTLHQLIKEYRTSNKIATNVEHRLMYTNYPKFDTATFMTKLEIFKNALNNTLGLDLYKILWKKSQNSETWLDRRTNYSRSLAVMSMVGYILGLGDRHPSNLMLDRKSGKILHIDFGDCFEVAMKRERFPERVPFRLTRMLIKALEVSGIEGTYRITCENVMRVLRANKDSLIAILTAFVHDPLISFRLLIPLIMKEKKRRGYVKEEHNDKITSESLRNDRVEDIIDMQSSRHRSMTKTARDSDRRGRNTMNNNNNDVGDIELEKKRMGSAERQLYIEFEEREEVESDDLNKIAKIVLERIIDKLQGTDFSKIDTLDVKQQVEKLIRQATSHENLSQSYLGWCPFW